MNILDTTNKSLSPMPNNVGVLKADKFKWRPIGVRGIYREISKYDLKVDGRYQRDAVSTAKVIQIAREFDWLLFDTLSVVERPNQGYFVFDGGQRTRATFYRDEIDLLPCMVHVINDISEEARAFVRRNTWLTNVSACDRYRAAVTGEEADAIVVSGWLQRYGLTVRTSADAPHHIKCISLLREMARIDPAQAERVLVVALSMRHDRPIQAQVLGALWTLCQQFKNRDVLTEFAPALAKLTMAECEKAIRVLRIETGLGGTVIAAKAIARLLNKGKRNKLTWDIEV